MTKAEEIAIISTLKTLVKGNHIADNWAEIITRVIREMNNDVTPQSITWTSPTMLSSTDSNTITSSTSNLPPEWSKAYL